MAFDSKDKTRYDELIPLFVGNGNEDDRRPRLYLDILWELYKKNGKIEEIKDASQLKNKYYSRRTTGIPDDAVNEEWNIFLRDLNHQVGTNDKVIEIIKKYAGVVPPGKSQLDFIQKLIMEHFIIYDALSKDITASPSEWINTVRVNKNNGGINNIFNGIPPIAGPIAGTIISNYKYFSFNLSKHALYEMLERAAKISYGEGVDEFWTTDDKKDTYFRLSTDRTKLFTTDNSGNKIDISEGTDAFKQIYDNDQCMGTKVKQNGSLTCADYLTQCINRGNPEDISDCKQFMLEPNFWDIVKDEIEKMHPLIAKSTLESFGFKTKTRNGLIEFESYGSWSQSLEDKIDKSELKKIRENSKLSNYLQMIVTKINSNPAILNESYNAEYSYDPEDFSNRFNGWSLTARGIKPRGIFNTDKISIIRYLNNYGTILSNLRFSVNQALALTNGIVYINGRPIGQIGGGIQSGGAVFQFNPLNNTNAQEPLQPQHNNLKNLIFMIEQKIKTNGKSLHHDTLQHINKNLESFKNSEEKLIKAIRYADRYLDLLEIYKEYDKDNILTFDHLKKFVEAREYYFDKTHKRQNDLLNAIQSIANTVNEELDKN